MLSQKYFVECACHYTLLHRHCNFPSDIKIAFIITRVKRRPFVCRMKLRDHSKFREEEIFYRHSNITSSV